MSICCFILRIKIFKIIFGIFVIMNTLTITDICRFELYNNFVHLTNLQIVWIKLDSINSLFACYLLAIVLDIMDYAFVI
jgi:hypothetical protein